jgi:hypothetical protein
VRFLCDHSTAGARLDAESQSEKFRCEFGAGAAPSGDCQKNASSRRRGETQGRAFAVQRAARSLRVSMRGTARGAFVRSSKNPPGSSATPPTTSALRAGTNHVTAALAHQSGAAPLPSGTGRRRQGHGLLRIQSRQRYKAKALECLRKVHITHGDTCQTSTWLRCARAGRSDQ